MQQNGADTQSLMRTVVSEQEKQALAVGPFAAPSAADPPAFPRTVADQAAWDAATQTLSSEVNLTVDGTSGGKLKPNALRIDAGFRFVSQPEDADFSPLHIEPLIDQAADLLDRGLRDRVLYDELAEKAVKLALEIGEYAELDAIHADEEAAAIYAIPAFVSSAELASETLLGTYANYSRDLVKKLRDNYYSAVSHNEQFNAARKMAWLNGAVAYTWAGQTFAGYTQHVWGGVSKTVSDWSIDAAEKLSSFSLNVSDFHYFVQQDSYDSAGRVSSKRQSGLQSKATWDQANISFQKRRTLAARKYQDIKARASVAADGSLNFQKRMEPLRERFAQDFRDALARLLAVREGLLLVYGLDTPLPADSTSVRYFDDCLLWTRKVIQWLIRFSRQEQSMVIPFSVRQLIGDTAWKAGLKAGKWDFKVDNSHVLNGKHARLRGLSAYSVGEIAMERLLQVEIDIPKEGVVKHLSGSSTDLDQSRIPTCRLMRVRSMESQRDPDVTGIVSLFNASPVGSAHPGKAVSHWQLRVIASVPSSKDWSELSDFVICLHVAYRM